MRNRRHDSLDWSTPATALALLLLLALLLAALTADGQTCGSLPNPYPSAHVSAAGRATLRAELGPWEPGDPVTRQLAERIGLALSYPDLETMRSDLWDRALISNGVNVEAVALSYYRGGQRGRRLSAWWRIAEVVKPAQGGGRSWIDLGTGEVGNEALGHWRLLTGREPTVGQYVQIDAHHVGQGSRWWPDPDPADIYACRGGGPPPAPSPAPPPPPPAPVPPPPPTEPPACTPYEGSNCQARCVQVGKDREWCLSPERETGARHLFNLCTPVCRDGEPGEPEPEPEPEPEEPTEPELECWTGTVTGRFIPGVPSTGRLEVELFRVDCSPAEGGS